VKIHNKSLSKNALLSSIKYAPPERLLPSSSEATLTVSLRNDGQASASRYAKLTEGPNLNSAKSPFIF
jgi:hypothetical protein